MLFVNGIREIPMEIVEHGCLIRMKSLRQPHDGEVGIKPRLRGRARNLQDSVAINYQPPAHLRLLTARDQEAKKQLGVSRLGGTNRFVVGGSVGARVINDNSREIRAFRGGGSGRKVVRTCLQKYAKAQGAQFRQAGRVANRPMQDDLADSYGLGRRQRARRNAQEHFSCRRRTVEPSNDRQ